MFCTKCGKKIDDDSRFCTYCGEKVTGGSVAISSQNTTKIYYQRGIHKKFAVGLAGCIIAIIFIFVVVQLFFRGMGDNIAEQLFLMSWEEISKLSYSDMEERLNEENILYKTINTDNSWMIKTQNTTSFMDADCLLVHGSSEVDNDTGFEPSLSAQFSVLGLACETEKGFKNVKAEMETYLNKQLIEGAIVFKTVNEEGTSYLYTVEASDKNVDRFRDYVDENEREVDLEGCSIYKFVQLFFAKSDDLSYFEPNDFPSDKNYTDYMCEVTIFYTPMTQEDFIAFAATYNYDAILGKNMELDELRKGDNISSLDQNVDLKESDLRAIYFVENHDMDIRSKMDVNSDEQKKIWYIRNYDFDVETNKKIDISEWGSIDIYIAYTFNYDVKNDTYFESDLDRTKYLIDNNRNSETGEPFKDSKDARLWSMKSLGYDPQSGKEVDTLLADALEEYQRYLDGWENKELWGNHLDAALIYLDADDIPELIVRDAIDVASATAASDYTYVLKYTPSGILNFELETDGHTTIYYVPKSGEFCTNTCAGNLYYGFFVETFDKYLLNERSLDEVENLYYSETYDDNKNLTGIDASSGLSADFTVSDYIESRQELVNLYDRFIELRSWDNTDLKVDIFDLYDDLRITKYTTYEYCIYQFEINNGILTVTADDGVNGADSFGLETPFSFSYPISEDCIWEDGYGYDRYRYEYGVSEIDMEDVIESIKRWRGQYEKNPDYIESPVGIRFCIEDEVVIGVYTSTP